MEQQVRSYSRTAIDVGGFTVRAPGFTPVTFDRAVQRAFDEGLIAEQTDTNSYVTVRNPSHATTYLVSRSTCTCKAGQRGSACKHRAYAIYLADVAQELPGQPQRQHRSA